MIFKNYQWKLLLKVVLLFAVLVFTAYVVVRGNYSLLIICLPVIAGQLWDMVRFLRKSQDELDEFVESVHYRDFSRHFDVSHAPAEIQPLRKGFNEINSAIKVISRERETQYQYLQKSLNWLIPASSPMKRVRAPLPG